MKNKLQCKCLRCNHTWTPRSVEALKALEEGRETGIKRCPKCTSPYWNKPRKIIRKKS